jgi:hypothetical protein
LKKKPKSLSPKRLLDAMKNLAERIKREFREQTEKRAHCAVYEDELVRIWPLNENDRKAKIEHFGKARIQVKFLQAGAVCDS